MLVKASKFTFFILDFLRWHDYQTLELGQELDLPASKYHIFFGLFLICKQAEVSNQGPVL